VHTANVVKQKHGVYSQREHKAELLAKLTTQYNDARPVQGEGAQASDGLKRVEQMWDNFEQTSRESAVPQCGATVPPTLPDVPLEWQANMELQRDLAERKLAFGFEVVHNLRRRTVEASGEDQDVICVVGKDVMHGFQARGAAQVDTGPMFNLMRDHFLVPEYNSSQRCPLCFGWSKFVRAASYREKECKNCSQYVPLGGDHPRRSPDFTFRFDRDHGAAVNFLSILCFMMRHRGLRPQAFAPKNAKDVYNKNN
jgi:hypothetical protein